MSDFPQNPAEREAAQLMEFKNDFTTFVKKVNEERASLEDPSLLQVDKVFLDLNKVELLENVKNPLISEVWVEIKQLVKDIDVNLEGLDADAVYSKAKDIKQKLNFVEVGLQGSIKKEQYFVEAILLPWLRNLNTPFEQIKGLEMDLPEFKQEFFDVPKGIRATFAPVL